MSDLTKKGSIVFGLIMFALGIAWAGDGLGYYATTINWGSLVAIWIGIGSLGFSLSKFS